MFSASHHVGSDSGHTTPSAQDVDKTEKTEEKDIGQSKSSDIEYEAERRVNLKGAELYKRSEKTELTPVEALTWSVDGDQSPFPEVAACVNNTDDSTIACNTVRAWILTTIFVILLSGLNQFFGLRYPFLSLGYVVAQLLVFPIGRAWEKLPRWRVPLGRFTFDVNPGVFTTKEHALIVICVNVSTNAAYGLGSLAALSSPIFWNHDNGAGFAFLYLLTSQSLGFGLAGLTRRWTVYPAALIWPNSLTSTVLFRTLHEPKRKEPPANGWTMSRYRFFSYFTIIAFVIFLFPDYIWTSLSTFAFITWIFPTNQKVNVLFGMKSGLGLLPISFDWTQINYAGSPLITPFYITRNAFAVIVLFYFFISPILYYTNVWNSAYLSFLSASTFDNTGKTYNTSRVVDKNLNLIPKNYEAYSPMYISMSYSITFALSFAAVTSLVIHTYLYNGKDIWAKFKDARSGGEDIHKRLMNQYKEVPDWWYLNVITELMAGYIWPGKPIANMYVKVYGYNAVRHGMDFIQDLKLGQYMKIPPRVLFVGQIYSTILASAVQTGVFRWMLSNIKDLCKPTNKQRFTCNGAKTVYSASLIWGSIGPQRMFQPGQVYNAIMYFFLIGPVVTVLVWLVYRRYPHTWVRYINVPIFFNAAGLIPPATTTQYSLWFIFGYLFNYLIRRRKFDWWKRYNYLLQAAMDTGTALATVLIFFALSYNNIEFNWWGNTVGEDTYDSKSVPWLKVKNGSYFGKGPGEF
ncbi:hypothetical protein HYALB_00003656 [Hymenoscyphus albidus]|uniref:OPT family small oligopeptide transporter n=1 Tax=Hymenoscyphus albidus TaxID=595503 RepID=A0A9N9LHK0_9HELO|nr:hypothetical protein HYALB_00003656 [Hymenoscyphus albidus]